MLKLNTVQTAGTTMNCGDMTKNKGCHNKAWNMTLTSFDETYISAFYTEFILQDAEGRHKCLMITDQNSLTPRFNYTSVQTSAVIEGLVAGWNSVAANTQGGYARNRSSYRELRAGGGEFNHNPYQPKASSRKSS